MHLGLIRLYFSSGDVDVGEMRGRNVPLEERGKRKDVLGGRRKSFCMLFVARVRILIQL